MKAKKKKMQSTSMLEKVSLYSKSKEAYSPSIDRSKSPLGMSSPDDERILIGTALDRHTIDNRYHASAYPAFLRS